jgi:DNA-binding NtrC family response regulator
VSRSILLIDDDAEILGLLGRFFERKGWDVLRAAEPRGAATLYERERPDLVLLDIDLPGMTGLQLLDVLRARDPDATVVMLTGMADIGTAVEAMRLGAENFLTKPVELAHLEAAVERALEKVQLRRRYRFFAERQAGDSGPRLPHPPGSPAPDRPWAPCDFPRSAGPDGAVRLAGQHP